MRDRIIIAVGLLFIAACALFVVHKIESHYRAPAAPVLPDSWTPGPLVPSSPAATTPAAPASPRPTHTITVWVTTTAGGDGR